jgi:trehalose-6-phosphate synthase
VLAIINLVQEVQLFQGMVSAKLISIMAEEKRRHLYGYIDQLLDFHQQIENHI